MTTTGSAKSGLDLRWIDKNIRPQDDLYGHVNGKWLASHEIPADRSQTSTFRTLLDQAEIDVRDIIQEASKLPGADAQQVANLYQSFMDTDRIAQLGSKPIQPTLDEIAAVSNKIELAQLLGKLQRQGYVSLLRASVDTDMKDSSRYIMNFSQDGLGLPDESYYKNDKYVDIRKAYVAHISTMATLAGLSDPDTIASQVMALESKLADCSWNRVDCRDVEKTYNLRKFTELESDAPGFAWRAWMEAFGAPIPALNEVVVKQPSFIRGAGKLWDELPLEQWKAWMKMHTIVHVSPDLSDEFVNENFKFFGTTLSGVPENKERWKRGVTCVQDALGEAVGKIYVKRHFPPAAKERMTQLVTNLEQAYHQSIDALEWMGPETREKALVKLSKFNPKIGYPNKWKDYSALEVKADDLVGNQRRAAEWATDYEVKKLGQPVDKDEWFMTPQTVNAYYNPTANEIVFPAAILQPPFFDLEADDAVNYGGIGAVIAHEIGHGFDDQGSRFDGDGNMINWWTADDRTEFEKRTNALIEQYNALNPIGLPDHKVNGALCVGENVGDLGGLSLALKAYEMSLNGEKAPVIDGLTGVQRVLFGWAQIWRAKTRDTEAIRRLAIDPHSPPDLRCNGIVTNVDAFYDAFDVKKNDGLWTEVDQRVRIW